MLRCHELPCDSIDALARSPHDGALLLIGAPGSGKSTVLATSLEQRAEGGSLVRVNPGEAAWPLSGVSALLASLGDPRIADFAGRFALRSDDDAALAEAAAELLVVLRGLGLPRTLLLVDDIDRMDAASRRIVGYMAGHLAGSGIRIVAAAAEVAPDEPLAGLPSVRIGELDDTEARGIAPPGIDPGTLRILVSVAAGNLGTLVALLSSLSSEQLSGRDGLRLPPRPGPAAWAAVERVARRLGAAHLAELDRLATAPLHPRAAAGRWAEDAEDALQELLDLGVVQEAGAFVALADPLVRAALSDALPSRVRRELHVSMRETAGPLLEAWHASWADPGTDLRDPLLDAAAEAARLGYPHAAVEFADRALRSGRDGLAGRLARVADELLTIGEPELAYRYLNMASADRHLDPDARVRLSISRLRADYLAGRAMDPNVELAGADPELVARWAAMRAAVSAARGEFHAARGPLVRVEADLASESPETRSLARTARALLDGPGGGVREGDEAHDPLLMALHARAETLAGDYPRARVLIGRLASSLVRPSRMWAGWLTALAIDCASRAGRIGEAFELARDWRLQHAEAEGPPGMVPLSAWTSLADADLEAAEAVLAEWTDNGVARVGPLPTARGLLLRAELARLRGDVGAACELLLLADTVAAAIDDPALSRHLPELAETLVEVGRTGAAHDAARRLAAAAVAHPGRWSSLAVARVAVSTATVTELRDRHEAALALHRRDDDGFELGKLHLAYGRRLAAAGAAHEAARAVADARIAFAGAGARPWAAAASGDAQAPVPRTAAQLELLSADERAVADLVVRGLHNKEIAAALYLSVRTVELRLTHIYRKVGARSRAHLVSLMS